MTADTWTDRGSEKIQVCFFFNAQRHQVLHGIATAIALARLPNFDVFVVSPAEGHVEFARATAEKLGGAPITFVYARSRLLTLSMKRTGGAVPPKLLSLTVLARWLDGFDAIALPERTSIFLRKIGVSRPRFIHLDHGAGDRAAGFDRRIRHFDFVLMAGSKHRERLMGERLITPHAHAVVGYPKFEAADAIRDARWRPFANDLPTVLYNPHFSSLGSWEAYGAQVMDAFATQARYNLILAPHIRLLDSAAARERWASLLDRYEGHPNIHIDRGTDRTVDMTYTTIADLYLGDVSSQVYEFLRTPRPCLFLNPHGVDWSSDENYAHWRFGPVINDAHGLIEDVDRSFAEHPQWVREQEQGIARTFLTGGGAGKAAESIADYLGHAVPPPAPVRRRERRPGRRNTTAVAAGLQRAALLLPILLGGWLLNDVLEPSASQAASSPFLDRAVASHRTTLLRQDMPSQNRSLGYDPRDIRRATGIVMPNLPRRWRVGDVQLYPSTYGSLVHVSVSPVSGEPVSLVAMRIETPAEAQPVLEVRATEQIAYWENGDMAYALVGRISSQRLLGLASEIAGQNP